MKRVTIISCLLFSWLLSSSQMNDEKKESWQIKWNKKAILDAAKESESGNVVVIDTSHLSKKTCLEVIYKESGPEKEKAWNRSFLFFGDSETELLRKENTRDAVLKIAELKMLFKGQTKIRIYTLAIPSDPDLAARVRVRRVHMATLEFK